MNKRLDDFKALRDHAWMGKIVRKLSQFEILHCEMFLEQTKDLDVEGFYKALRLHFVDMNPKPTHWKEMNELLLAVRRPL